MVNLVRATGGLLIVSGHTYKVAEEASTIGSALPAGADKGALAASSPYKLPGVTEGFPESDPPPSGLMQMLFFVESLVGGCQWPDGNLDGLVSVAQAWRAVAYSIRLVAEEVRGHARVVTANNAGEATQSFATFAEALQGGGDAGGLLWLAGACEGMAGSVENLLRQKNAARLQFTLSLEFLAVTWALAMAISVITGGGSIAAATATTQAEGFALKAFLRSVLKAVVAGAWFSGGLDAAGQYSRIHYGLQKGFDGGEFVKAVGEGAVAGGVMGVGGAWIGMGRTRLTKALSGWMSSPGLKGAGARFLVAGSTGTAGNVAAQAAFDKGHVDWTQAAAFGFGMAGIEGVKDAGRHTAAQFTGPHPGDGSTPGHTPGDVPPQNPPHNPTSDGGAGGDGRVHQDGTTGPRTYPHYSDRGVGYDLQAGPGDYHWNTPTNHPTAETPPTHVPTTELATDHPTPPAASNIPHYDITSFGRENPAGGTDHGGPAGPLPAVPMGMDNGALPSGSRPNVPAVPDARTPAPAHGDGPVAGPVRPPAGAVAPVPDGRPAALPGGTPESTPPPATTPARTEANAPARFTDTAHRALTEARQIVAPDGLLLQDGSVRLTDRSGQTVHIPEDVLRHVEERLASRAADGATVERLRAEAAAWMGAEIARSGHQPPVGGALDALQRLSDHSPDNAVAAAALSREVRRGDRNADPARRLLDEDAQTPPDPTLRPHLRDATAREILEQAKNLAADPSHQAPAQGSAHAQHHGGGHPDASGTAAAVVRPPHVDHLSMDEVRSALDRLRPSDFGRGVTGWHWSADGMTLHVETESWGTLDVKTVIGELPENLSEFHRGKGGAPHVLEIARWAMSKEAAEAAGLPPAEVAEAGEVLPQVLRHAITDGVQRSVAEHARSGQGVIRRLAENVRAAVRNDGQVERLINDHRAAASTWREATDPAERTRIAEQISQIGQDLQTAGQTPPEPPWVEGADGFMPGHTPPTPLSELTGQARHMADALHQDAQALAGQITAHQVKAHDARMAADKALDDAITAADQKDRGAPERARQAFGRAEAQEAEARRHEHLADNYQEALDKAVVARTAYRALESNLERQAGEPHSAAMTKVYADAGVLLARRGEEAYTTYEQALDAVLPPDFVKPDAILTDRLPLRNRLTDTANKLVAGEKIPDELFPADFERRLLAQTGDLLSKDGARVAVGKDGAEIVVTMEINHLVEDPYPDVHPGEQAVGAFHEGGQTNSAAANHSSSTGYEFDSGKLAQLVPGDHPVVSTFREVMKVFGPSFEADHGQGWSESASHLNHAQKGAVGNIRGGNVTVVEGVPEFHVRLVRADGSETAPVHVTTGAHGDATTAKALVSNSYTLEPPKNLAQLPFGERQQVPLPHHLATPMGGVEEHCAKTIKAVEAEHGPLSPADRESLRELLKAEAKNHSGGLRFAPGADVFLRTKLRLDVSQAMPMAASKVDFMERVNVGLIGTSGSEVYNVSTGGSAGFPINPFTKAVDVMPGHNEFNVGFDARLSGSRTVTHTETVSVGGTTIPVTVVRHVGNTVAYVFPRGSMVLETHVYSARTNHAIGPITQEVSGLLRFEESDAYHYGLPVDDAALVRGPDGEVARHPDGSAVLRDDPKPGAPEGRKPMLPSHIGDGPGQLRGFGDAAVEFSGIEESAAPVMAKLRELGVLPELDAEGLPHPAEQPNLAEIVAQGQAQRKMEELADRVHANADQAAQLSGIKTRLPRVTPHGVLREYELETYVEQDFHDWNPVGKSGSKQLIKLDIDSQSNGQTETRAVARSGGGGASVGHKPAASGAEEKLGGDVGRNGGSSTSKAASFMNNVLGIRENPNEMSVGEQPVTYRHRLYDPDGNVVEEWSSKGRVTVGTPLDWLPGEDAPLAHAPLAAEATPTSPKVAEEAQWHHFDAGDLINRVHDLLREKGVQPPGGIATCLDGKSLSANSPKWLGHGYETPVTIDPHGMQPTRYKIRVTGTLEPSTYYTEVNQVSGDIGLSAVGLTSTEGKSGGHSMTGSGGGTAHHGDSLTDGGSGDIKKAAGTSSSHSESNTSGVERLKIGIDPDVSYRTVAHLDVQITDTVSGWTEHVTADAKGVYSLSESDALKLQARGELTLPPEHMADVVQRFLDGTLVSDPQVVARQVDRYLGQLAEARHAGDPVPALSAGHTAQVLAEKVESLPGIGKSLTQGAPEQRLGQTLPDAHSLATAGPPVGVPAMFEHAMATSLFEGYEFHGRDGREMSVHDAVLEALRQRSPRVLETDPSLGQRLSARFEGRGWEGLVDEMFDHQGSGREYDVRVDGTGRMEKLGVHAKLTITGPPTLEGVTKHVVSLHQSYGWEGQSHSTGSNRSLGGDVGAADGSPGGGANGSLATGRSRSMSGTRSHTHVELNRLRWFDAEGTPPEKAGMATIKHPVTIKVTVDQHPVGPGQKGAKGQPDVPGPVTVEIKGYVERLIPARMVEPVAADPAAVPAPERPVDPRPVELDGNRYYVQWVEAAQPYDVMRETFVDLLGKGSERRVEQELSRQWSALVRHSPTNFQRMVGEEGYEIRIQHGNRAASVRIHLDARDLRIDDIGGAEASRVNRDDSTTATSVTVGHLLPASGTVEVKDGVTGIGVKRSAGTQASQTFSDGNGHRIETNEFIESDHAGTGSAKATFRMDFSRGRKHVHHTAEGEVHLTLAGPELDGIRAKQEAGDLRDQAWDLDARSGSGGHNWDVVQAEEGRTAAPLTQAIMQAQLGNHDVFIEVRESDGRSHHYRASPDGRLYNEDRLPNGERWSDGGFAPQFAGMPRSLGRLADENQIDLRRLFEQSPVPGTLSDKVRAELEERGVTLPPDAMPVRPPRPTGPHRHGSALSSVPGTGSAPSGGPGGGGGT